MLQPRSCRIACLLLVFLVTGLAEDQPQEDEIKERVKRENGDVTVLSLEEIVRLREAPVGVLSSTARTFVTGGATTEFATQILGTTVGRTYAKLLSTGSRVYYDNAKPTKDSNPFLVFPSTLPLFLNPASSSERDVVRPTIVPKIEFVDPMTILPINNEIIDVPETHSTPSLPPVSVRKEFSVKRNSEVKPAKVKPNADLPTVTIKAEFAPSGYSDSIDERRDKKLRSAKGLFRGGVQIKNEFQKYDTVTYVGFADFTTTVGNTVIVFMPKTAVANNGPVTSIAGAATLRPEDAVAPVVTTVKTFLSHSPAMATKTVTGHNLNVQTALPTVQADTRASKAYNPVYVTTEDSDEVTDKNTTPFKFEVTEKIPTTEEIFTTEHSTGAEMENDIKTTESENLKKEEPTTEKMLAETESSRKELPTTEQTFLTTDVEELTTPEGSEVEIPHEEVQATESLKVTPTFMTSSTKVFIPGDKPLGLAKSIAAIEAYDETTTFYTSFLFGTIVDGEYTQLTQVVSSVSSAPSISPTPVVSELPSSEPSVTSENPITESAESTTEEGIQGVDEPESLATKLVTKLVPTTVHQTYTYLTTFFVPQDDTTTTSVRTREVVSDEIRYVATVVPENVEMPTSETIMSSEVTQNYMTTTPSQESRTEEATEQSTPPLLDSSLSAVTQEISPKTEEPVTTEATTEVPAENKSNQNTPNEEEEVEVIIRTLYTTYTYLTTFFQESTTSVQSREVVKTNVVTSTLDSSLIPEATDPAVAGLFSPSSVSVQPVISSEVPLNVVERPPSDESFFKTYTYYTTVFVDGETIVESRTEVVKETVQPTVTSTQVFKTASYEDNSIIPKQPLRGGGLNQRKKPSYGTISRPKAAEGPSSEALIMPHLLQSSIDEAYSYDTTMSPIDRVSSTVTMDDPDEAEMLQAREEELKKEAMLAIGMTTTDDSELVETMVTDITSSSSGGNRRKSFDEYESDPNDQISSESNTEEIEPSFSPTVVLQTSYTTFTYFTTVYKGTSSDIVSRLETVTNVVTETIKPTEIEPKLSPEEATLPITYFTTFTYWTTLYKGKSTMITSREETVSNIVTPTLETELSSQIEMTESPSSPTKSIDQIIPTVPVEGNIFTTVATPLDVFTISNELPQPSGENADISPTEVTLEPTTYYTTYTYFTTSYIDNETVINSHLETETNIETPTSSLPVVATEIISSSQLETDEAHPVSTLAATQQPVGLISTIRSSEVNEGVTTLLLTDIYGTYIDGFYAQVLESSSEIVAPSPIQSTQALQPTGVVSINEGKIVDANGVTTTLFTTKAIGTYIDALYAQVLESTSSVVVDEAKQTSLPQDESTTVVGTKLYTTGLVRLIEGSIVKDLTTTFYESRVIGTLIDGRYAQIIESTSSFKAGMTSTADVISPTSTLPPASGISPTSSLTTSSPAVLEGSQPKEDEEEEEEKDDDDSDSGKSRFQGKKKTFTPVIRPFSSRPRPTFQPKKKTGDPATTITRTSFTPTVTATPASKTGFGSSRNRFAANRSKSSTNSLEIKPTASSSRRFSRPRSSSAPSFGGGSSSRGRSSSRVQPSASSSLPRRGGFSYRSTGRPNLIIPSSTRARIRPTGVINRFASSQPVDDINNNDITGTAVTEEVEHNTASSEEEEEQEQATSAPTTTTESSRRAGNPLLRFRRPPIFQRTASTTTTTPKPSTTSKRTPSLLRRPDSRSSVSVTTTPRSRPTVSFNRLKPRPASSLFPPRGLSKKPVQEEPEEEEKEEQVNEENIEDEIEDNEYEGSETAEQTSSTTTETAATSRRGKALSPVVQIRPFTRRPRTKRQADYGNKYSARFRRPSPKTYEVEDERTPEPVSEAPRQQYSRSYNGRSRSIPQQLREYSREPATSPPRVRPSPVPSTPRHQFTLRERGSQQTTTSAPRSNFRRPTSSPRRRPPTELTTQSQRLSRPVTRQRTVTTEAPSYSRGTSRRYNTHPQQSRRTTARTRYRDSNEFDTYSPKPFDGTITVTHKVPTEVTIPIINGKNTEYKPVITAKPSLEVLSPFQYTNIIGKDGKSTIILNNDVTSTLPNGIMEVTKFFVFETPTTSVTFTPTTLRGRKTSFSHIIPSTVYEVRPEVSTIQPNLGDNPLANILLSQLLLGNLGQPTIPGQPQSPVTEYKTKTTTYVTTVTSHTSTILPLTFRGKEITTTIVDSSTQVITATEYLTETVVITPTAVIQPAINNQLNTLLLPALLQAQLLNKPTPNPVQWPQKPPTDDLYDNDRFQEPDDLSDKLNRDKDEEEDRKVRESIENEQKVEQKPSRKKSKIKLKEKDKDTGSTIVTLYVSGKHPGEFTTLLSTVPVGSEGTGGVRKREIDSAAYHAYAYKIQASKTPQLGSSFIEEISNFIAPTSDGVTIDSSEVETLSVESDLSDIGRYLDVSKSIQPEIVTKMSDDASTGTGHFLLLGHADSAPDQRKATTRSSSFLTRTKRDAEARKVIKIRVPIKRKRISSDNDFYESAASSPDEEIAENLESTFTTEANDRKVKRILVARRRPQTEPKRKRILVTRRKPNTELGATVDDTFDYNEAPSSSIPDPSQNIDSLSPTTVPRRVVLKTKKRLITSDVPFIESTEGLHKRRVIVTKRRPIQKESDQSSNMRTLYNYQYSIPSDEAGHSVMVSEIFMTGLDLPAEVESDSSYKELMENIDEPRNDHDEQDQEDIPDERELEEPLAEQKVAPEEPQMEIKSTTEGYYEEDLDDHVGELPNSAETPAKRVNYEALNETHKSPSIQESTHQTTTEAGEEIQPQTQAVEGEKVPEYYYEENYEQDVGEDGEEEYSIDVEENTQVENEEFQLDPTYVTIFPYETTSSETHASESPLSFEPSSEAPLDTTSTSISKETSTLIPDPTPTSNVPITTSTTAPIMGATPLSPAILETSTTLPSDTTTDFSTTETPPIDSAQTTAPDITTEYQTITKTLTNTRDRTFTYVVTRVSGDEQYVTSSTTVKPFVKTTTVTEIVPVTSTQTAEPSSIRGRGLFVIEPRHNLATKVMANGVEVIVAGSKSTLPGSPKLKVIPTGLAKPITLAPSTLTDHMMMVLPHESQKPQNEFVTKTYMTTYTYLTTFAEGGSTVVSSREKVVHNKVTEEVNPSTTVAPDHITLSNSPSLTTGVYHTTYTYLNTLVDGEQPLVVTSKKTVANTKVEPLLSTQPSAQPQTTNTYVSTVAYTQTVNDGDLTKLVQTEDVLTQVVITESDYLPSSVPVNIRPTPITTDLTKTYFATYTYFNTQVVDGNKVVKTEVLTSSDVVTETFTIQPKKTTTERINNEPSTALKEPEPTNSINLYATKTYLTTFTYFTTLLQDNSSPSTIVKSRTKVQQNIVTETIDGGLIDPDYLNILKSSLNDNDDPITATAALSNGNKMEVTAVASKLVSPSQHFEVGSSYEETPSNIVTGSTIIFFDDEVQSTPTLETSFFDAGVDHTAEVISTPSLISTTPVRAPTSTKTKLSSPEDGDESMLVEMATDAAASSGGSGQVNNIFNGLSALGPVINAMADLFQNNIASSKRKNQTKINAPQAFAYTRPLETINKNGHNNHPSPVYIPSPEPLDSEVAESQNIGGLNGFDINQRTPGIERPSIEAALLSGGIPISPGQVIRTNSDVIIGKHSAHGPRPPNKPFKKNDVVEGMKPPPPPNYSLSSSSHPSPGQPQSKPVVDIPSNAAGQGKPSWSIRDQERYPSVLVPQRVSPAINQEVAPLVPPPLRQQLGSQQKQPPKHVSLDQGLGDQKYSMQIDPPKESFAKPHKYFKNPPIPRPNDPIRKEHVDGPYNYEQRPAYVFEKPRHPPSRPLVLVNREDVHNDDRIPLSNMSLIQNVNYAISHDTFSTTPANDHGLLVNIQPSQVANVVIPHEVSTALIYSTASDVPSQKGEIFNEPSPYPDAEVGMVGVAGLSTSNGESAHIPSNAIRLDVPVSPQVVDIQSFKRRPPINPNKHRPERPNVPHSNVLLEHSPANQRPTVDIQSFKRLPPTNLNRIRPEYPNVPPSNVLFEQTPSAPSYSDFNKRPKPSGTNWIRPELQNVPPTNVMVEHSASHADPSKKHRPTYTNRVRPNLPDVPSTNVQLEQSSSLEYMTPPSPHHPISQISSYVNYHLPKEQPEDQEGDYSVNNEYHTESEEAQNAHSTNKAKPIWGTKVSSGFVLPNAPRPFNPFVNYTAEQDSGNVQYSVINSKPVVLSYDSTEKQPPIVKGKPGVTTFDNKDEATVSVGLPTKLAPADESSIVPTASNKQDDAIVTSFDFTREKPLGNRPSKPSIDNIKSAMNIDEKPPLPTNETPVLYDVQSTVESSVSAGNAGIGGDRNPDDEVLGLTPPALGPKHPPIERPTHRPSPITEKTPFRPSFPTRRPGPLRKRPPPPYKFEIPLSTVSTKIKKPNFSEILKPQDIPAESLSPPPKTPYYSREKENVNVNPVVEAENQDAPVSINPVLGGSLKVEDLIRKPEVITADVKVPMNGNIISSNNYQTRPEGISNGNVVHTQSNHHSDSLSSSSNILQGMPLTLEDNKLPIYGGHNSYNGIETKKPNSTEEDTHVFFGMKIPVVDAHSGSSQQNEGSHTNLFTISGSTDEWDTIIDSKPNNSQEVTPQPTQLYSPTPTPTSSFKPELDHIIVGSEIAYTPDNSVKLATQPIDNKTKIRFQQASTSNMIQVTTEAPQQKYMTPVRSVESGHSVIPLQLKNRTSWEYDANELTIKEIQVKPQPSAKPTTYVVTHTQTLTVTTTESRIVQSKGQKPSTHTLVVTKTHTSTILDTVTEIHTLVKPTSIVQTVTTTIPQATTTIFPSPTLVQGNVVPTVNVIQHFPHNSEIVTEEPDTILVVMSDKNSKNTLPHMEIDPNLPPLEIEGAPEENEVSPNVQLGSFLSRHSTDNECKPECKASRNERCQKINGMMRCVCRPGFARMFAERPCKPTYTFSMQVPLERVGKEKIRFSNNLMDTSSGAYQTLAEATKEGLDRMVMQSDLRDVYHGLQITGFDRNASQNDTLAKFYIQLSENTDETKLVEVFTKHLKTNNFSMGGTDLHASEGVEYLRAEDFDECKDTKFHDCSENAQCFNLKGTYTCSCKEGFTDLSHNTMFPGRICSAEMIGCERCNFHGNCFPRESEEDLCECFQWYAGQYCQINMKVLLLILSLVGISLVVLLIVCLVLSCMRRKPLMKRGLTPGQLRPPGFRLRPQQPQDKRAMISMDTSSEASLEPSPPPYIKQASTLQSQQARPQKPCRKQSKAPSPPLSYHGTMEQRDRSLTVMIPRAKYRPVPVQGSNLTMSTFGPEQKLLKYLTVEKPSQNSRNTSRKPSSNSTTNSQEPSIAKKLSQTQAPSRKPSTGALVSAGFEVSATVGRTKEIQEYFISEPHTDLNQEGGFSTIRTNDSSVLVDVPPPPTFEAELLDSSRIDLLTVSEARSYDETLIHPPTKCLRSAYDRNDESHTMGERDTGSTFVLPQSQLYKPERGDGSEISNFDSL